MSRLERFVARLATTTDVACAVIAPGATMTYLTGWGAHGSERLTLLFVRPDGRLAALVPKLEEQGAREAFMRNRVACEFFSHADDEGPQRALADLLAA
ncbi:MAG: aminopeptidase P family N-terminal domain-containing protein, partial [Firmicutes bacterium]|nr:aminopeptidase P family N-terminal domain-containing protein [Bacillota bacterium]